MGGKVEPAKATAQVIGAKVYTHEAVQQSVIVICVCSVWDVYIVNAARVELHTHHKKCKLKITSTTPCEFLFSSRHKTLKHKNMIC